MDGRMRANRLGECPWIPLEAASATQRQRQRLRPATRVLRIAVPNLVLGQLPAERMRQLARQQLMAVATSDWSWCSYQTSKADLHMRREATDNDAPWRAIHREKGMPHPYECQCICANRQVARRQTFASNCYCLPCHDTPRAPLRRQSWRLG